MNNYFYFGINYRLQIYISNRILPQYKMLDKAHGIEHIEYVIARSVKLAKKYKLNVDMMYCIAAFHDIGMLINREGHENYGAEILKTDEIICKLFNSHQIEIMQCAIKEHRASYKGMYTSIYSKAVSEADRSFDIYLMTKRSIAYGISKFPQYSYEQHYKRTYEYLKGKYGENGYSRMVLYFEEDAGKLEHVQEILKDEITFRKIFYICYKKCTEGNK